MKASCHNYYSCKISYSISYSRNLTSVLLLFSNGLGKIIIPDYRKIYQAGIQDYISKDFESAL